MLSFVLIKKIVIGLLCLLQYFQTLKRLPVRQIFLIYYRFACLKRLRTTDLNPFPYNFTKSLCMKRI